MLNTPENYAKTLSQFDHVRADVSALARDLGFLAERVERAEAVKASRAELAQCREAVAAARKTFTLAADKVAEITRRIYSLGPGDDDRARALRSCQGKRQYRTAEAAGQGAAHAKLQGSTDELRIYECSLCWSYHLTSRSLEDFAASIPEKGGTP